MQEDPTCLGTTTPVLYLPESHTLEPVLHKRSHLYEKPVHHKEEQPRAHEEEQPRAHRNWRKACAAVKTQHSQEINKIA